MRTALNSQQQQEHLSHDIFHIVFRSHFLCNNFYGECKNGSRHHRNRTASNTAVICIWMQMQIGNV